MTNQLMGKVAIVTGASRGIGRAIAERLGREGAAVVVNYVQNEAKAQEVVTAIEALGGRSVAVQGDMGNLVDIRRLFDTAEQQYGGLDILVNNAGITVVKPTTFITEDEFDRVFAVNAKGTFFALQEAAKRLRDGGRIVNISTGATISGGPAVGVYSGSKAAVEQFGLALAKELACCGITVNNVLAGLTDTDGMIMPPEVVSYMVQQTTLGRLGQPEDIADVVGFLVSDEGRWMTGQNVRAGGGLM